MATKSRLLFIFSNRKNKLFWEIFHRAWGGAGFGTNIRRHSMGPTKIMKENWLSEKFTSELFPPSETLSVIFIPPRNFSFCLIKYVMLILSAYLCGWKETKGLWLHVAWSRSTVLLNWDQWKCYKAGSTSYKSPPEFFCQWFDRSQKREKEVLVQFK